MALASTFIRHKTKWNLLSKNYWKSIPPIKNPIRPDIIAAAYQSLGNIYLELEDYDSSEQYFLLANEEFPKDTR